MRVSLVFPPALCLPNQLYFALPLLAGALRRAGHEPRIVDLNVLAADLLLDSERALRLLDDCAARTRLPGAHARALQTALLRGEPAKHTLRDPERFYRPELARDAFWTVVDVLAAFYQLDDVLSPYDDRFLPRMIDRLGSDDWTTCSALYDEGLVERVLRDSPQVVGLCVAFPEQSIDAVRLARRIRTRDPSIHLVAGGPLVTRLPEKWLEDDWLLGEVDSVVVGDGESAICELCDALEGRVPMERVRNLIWRDRAGRRRHSLLMGHVEPMDGLPVPDYSTADMRLYLQPEPIYPLMTSRGCYWGKCAMCSIGYQENYRIGSADKLERDVDAVIRAGGRFVQVQDSSIPPKGARMLADVVRRSGQPLIWGGWMKFERCFTDLAYCEEIAAGGCRSLQMGFESSDQRLLDLMQKGYRHADLLTMLRNLRRAGISTELLWFVGFPTQTRADVRDTARFLYEHRDEFGMSSFVGDFGLHPDCEVYREPAKFGVTVTRQADGVCSYETAEGMSMQDAIELKHMFGGMNNRTLTCNGCHLLHLGRRGLDLTGLTRPFELPAAALRFCAIDPAADPAAAVPTPSRAAP